jgi:diaminohydroxyphosphoribosylaminopyrimidine deaminase / 5-amino-6-(5-phosphoribosylamino)uracil reductase
MTQRTSASLAASASVSDSSASLDWRFMARANELALRTYPNPLVGAVVVRDGIEVGAGWHAEYGGVHAEVMALGAASVAARGATLYVTLEPCTHSGKQPPCVDAILAAGVTRVVIAAPDANPAAAGGAALLRGRGITVDIGLLERAAMRRNFRFVHRFQSNARPFVAVKLAVSMDGMIADTAGQARWLSNEAARAWVHWLRAGFGAIAIGARSAIADDARLTIRGELQPRLAPPRVIFDRSGRLPVTHPMFADGATGPVVVVVGTGAADAARAALRNSGAEIVVADELPAALGQLSERGIDSLLVEGGGRLAGALLRAGAVDRIYQIQCPLWLGTGTPAWSGLGAPAIASATRWQVTDVARFGEPGDVLMELEP